MQENNQGLHNMVLTSSALVFVLQIQGNFYPSHRGLDLFSYVIVRFSMLHVQEPPEKSTPVKSCSIHDNKFQIIEMFPSIKGQRSELLLAEVPQTLSLLTKPLGLNPSQTYSIFKKMA